MISGAETQSLEAQVALLSRPSGLDTGQDLAKTTKEFESIFLRKFLGDALQPLLHSTPGASAPGAGIYRYMVTDALASQLSESGDFGFSSLLQMQLAGKGESRTETPAAVSQPPTEGEE